MRKLLQLAIMGKVFLHQNEVSVSISNRKQLKEFLIKIFKFEKRPVESITIVFCTDAYLLKMNQDVLKHDFYTDIITFELNEKNSPSIGELYISIDRVRDNCKLHQTTLKEELHRVIFHGILHLCGYGDKTKSQITTMRSKENHYLKKYFKS